MNNLKNIIPACILYLQNNVSNNSISSTAFNHSIRTPRVIIFNEEASVMKSIRKISTVHNDLILQNIGDKGIIILNRPQALNALTIPMVKQVYTTLKEWETQKKLVIIKSAGGKAFCSGGDIRTIAKINEDVDLTTKQCVELLQRQYIVNGLIGSYKIPYIALIDGITMGGGVGLSVHGRYQVATENTVFAMPETQIGLFPDCGASYFLSRLSGRLGWYLGLTGHRLKGSDVVKAGLATHYCQKKDLNSLEKHLLNCFNEDDIKATLSKFNTDLNTEFTLTPVLEKINNYFSAETVEEIISRLKEDDSKWAKETLNVILKSCPISLKVTLRELELGKQLNLKQCLNMESRLISKFSEPNVIINAFEGITTMLNNKHGNPKWSPQLLSEISEKDVLGFFESSSTDKI